MKPRASLTTALIAIGVVAAAGGMPRTSHAQAPAANKTLAEQLVQAADKDHDGKLSAAELESFVSAHFDRLDTNHDGKLTKQEFEAPLQAAAAQASPSQKPQQERALTQLAADFQAMDKDHDGTVSKDEYTDAVKSRFERAAGATQGSGSTTSGSGSSSSAQISAEQLDSPSGAPLVVLLEPLIESSQRH